MNNRWWEISIDALLVTLQGSKRDRLAKAFDIKYGDYDYSNDVRQVCSDEFANAMNRFQIGLADRARVLICGANSGYEVPYLKNHVLAALDVSATALAHLKTSYSQVEISVGSMDDLPFAADSFDGYINLRAVQSVGVDLNKAINEALRVTKAGGSLLFSIPDGYMDNGVLIKGMLNGPDLFIDTRLPYTLQSAIELILDQFGIAQRGSFKIPSELFVHAIKKIN